MQISTFQLINYKSHRDSGELQLSTGFNVLVGQNNAGKSTLLEALGLKFISKPHRSLSALPRITSPVNPTSSAKVVLTVTGEELKDILLSVNGSFFVPCPNDYKGRGAQLGREVLQGILSSSTISFESSLIAPSGQTAIFQIARFPSHGIYETQLDVAGRANYYIVDTKADRTDFTCSQDTMNTTAHDFGLNVSGYLRERIYSFRAQRFDVGTCAVGTRNVLEGTSKNSNIDQ